MWQRKTYKNEKKNKWDIKKAEGRGKVVKEVKNKGGKGGWKDYKKVGWLKYFKKRVVEEFKKRGERVVKEFTKKVGKSG